LGCDVVKVRIGPYPRWFGPYQIAEKILFWKDKDDDAVFTFGGRLDKYTPIARIAQWFFHKRKVKIRIDPYDTWSMDHTLGLIIVPMLKQLKETKHGSPFVADEDVPEELRSTSAPAKKNEWDIDDNHHKRWEWVMDEMIWAFEQTIDERGGELFFDDSVTPSVYDRESHLKHEDRMDNGMLLFGKYYRGLWD
jgi:hypothetical protein